MGYENDLFGKEVFNPVKIQRDYSTKSKKISLLKRDKMVEKKARPNDLLNDIIKSKNDVVDYLDLKNIKLNKT